MDAGNKQEMRQHTLGLKGFLLVIMVFALVLFGQGWLMAAAPLPAPEQEGLPDRITFCTEANSYCFPLHELGLKITINWDNDIFSGYLLTCQNEDKLLQGLEELASLLNAAPQSAYFELDENGQVRIIPSRRGQELDQEELYRTLSNGNGYQKQYLLYFKETEAEVQEEDLARIIPDTLWASYETELTDLPNRNENIRIACRMIDGLILEPGQEFSFNEQVGPRKRERGFLEAPVIVGEKLVPGIGGGICQVSSTLYNAVMLAGLETTERHRHSLRVNYVPAGKDATVYYGLKDYKFVNNSEGAVLLKASVEGLKVRISIYGHGPKPVQQKAG